jgi:hypothetical protein
MQINHISTDNYNLGANFCRGSSHKGRKKNGKMKKDSAGNVRNLDKIFAYIFDTTQSSI